MKKNIALTCIQQMKPYSPPLNGRSQYGGILLDFNERTEASDRTMRALEQFVREARPQIYLEYFDLKKQIAEYAGVAPLRS